MSEYRVVISHEKPDEASAIAIRDALAQFSGDLEIFISGGSPLGCAQDDSNGSVI